METVRLTTAQALVKFLDNQYVSVDGKENKFVKGIFTLFGHGNVLGLGQALEQDPGDLLVYQGKNEQGMAHAAVAFAKQSLRRQIFACTSSVGPGAANMVTAAATATANNIPVLILPGDVYASRQPDPVLQQIEQTIDLGISTNDAFKPVSKYFDRINRPEQLMSAMLSAMRVLTDVGDTGAVTIALPQDVQAEAYDYPVDFFKKRVHYIERTVATKHMIDEAVAAIKNSKKPFIICGGGVRYSGAAQELADFTKEFNIPFGETQAGKSALPFGYEYNMGGIGVTGGLASNVLAKEADLVIGLGTRYTDFTTSSKALFQNPNVKFVNVNASRFQSSKLDGIPVTADVKEALFALTGELRVAGYKSGYTNEIKDAKINWETELKRLFNVNYNENDFNPEVKGQFGKEKIKEYIDALGTELTQTNVLAKLQDVFADDAIVIGASGSLPGDMQRIWLPKKPETYNMEYGYSCMGYEISGALGVKIACPNQEVYAMVGDGSFLMLHSEFLTSLQMDKKINIILLDNAGFGCINNLQMGNGGGSFGTEFRKGNTPDGEIVKVNYAKIAEGYGAKSYKVNNMVELVAAVEDAKKQKISTLIDIKVLPKTMTEGYESWWRVGVAEVSDKDSIKDARERLEKTLKTARQY